MIVGSTRQAKYIREELNEDYIAKAATYALLMHQKNLVLKMEAAGVWDKSFVLF